MTIDDILASLERRGFYSPHSGRDPWWNGSLETQIFAVMEEIGELSRGIRRDHQGVSKFVTEDAKSEAADVVIAAVCLLGAVAGDMSGDVIRAKLEADEQRGHLHNGGAS